MSTEDSTPERWLPIPGYEGRYDVSNHGRLRSLDSGRGKRETPLIMKVKPDKDGHFRFRLTVDWKWRRFFIHQLVLMAFVGPCPEGMVACHWDDVPANNHLGNLRWDTRSANSLDASRNGRLTHNRGERSACAKLTASDVRQIRANYVPRRVTAAQLAARYGVSVPSIRSIISRQNWAHLD